MTESSDRCLPRLSEIVVLLAVSSGLLACGGAQRCSSSASPPTSSELLSAYHTTRPALTALRGEARLEQRGPQGRLKGTILFVVSAGGALRFDAMTQFGPVATLASNGSKMTFVDQRQATVVTGPTCAGAMRAAVGIPLSADELASTLMGAPTFEQISDVSPRCDSGAWSVAVRTADGTQGHARFVETDAGRTELRSVSRGSGELKREVIFERYASHRLAGKTTNLPSLIRILDGETSATVRIKSVEAVDVPAPETFVVQIPETATTTSVGCALD